MTPAVDPAEERAQVDRLLADSLFSQSKRYASFLRYVADRAWRNDLEPLTERVIGVEVFGRAPNYDTEADPIVRVTASEIRKRLAHYYEDPAHAGEIRVVIHKGSYVAEFVTRGPAQPAVQEPVADNAALVAEPAAVITPNRSYPVAAIVGVCAVVAALIWFARPSPSAFDLFWRPVIDGPNTVLVSIPQFSDHVRLTGVDDPPLTWTDPLTPTPDEMRVGWILYSKRLVHVADLSVACRISEFLGAKGKRGLVKGEHDVTMRDLRENPAIVLGGLNNQWTSRLLQQGRFSFDGEGTTRFIRDKQNAAGREWKFDSKVPSGDRDRDLIIISRVSDSQSGRVVVLAGGFSAWGTEAAVELLTDPDQMKAVLQHAKCRWDARNLQIALECSVVNREAGIPRFLAVHYW